MIFLLPTLPPFLHPFNPLPTGPQSHNPPVRVRLATDPHNHNQPRQIALHHLVLPCLALPYSALRCPSRLSSRRQQPVPAASLLHLPCGCRQVHTHKKHARKPHAWVYRQPLYTPRAAEL